METNEWLLAIIEEGHFKRSTGKAHRYHAKDSVDKYRPLGHPIHLVGVAFSKATRNVVAFEVAQA